MNRPEAYIRRVQWHKDHARWFWTTWQDETGRERKPDEVRQFPGQGQEVLAEMYNGLCVFGVFDQLGLEVFRNGAPFDFYPWFAVRWCEAHHNVPGVEDVDFWE